MLKVWYAGEQLADGNRNSSVAEEIRDRVTGKAAVQTEQLIRDGQPTFFDRQTKSNALTITVSKQVSGYARALYLSLMRRQTLPGTGELVIQLVVDGTTHTWTAARAKCETTAATPNGASARITYQIDCGTFAYETTGEGVDDQIDGGTDIDMGTQILLRRHPRATILALIAAETFADAEPWIETDGGRSGVGNKGANAAIKDLGTVAIAAAGETTLGLVTWATEHRALITVAAGAYTRNIVLPNTADGLDASEVAFVAGDTIEARFEVAIDPSSDVIVNVYHDVASGTALLQLVSDAAGARNYVAQFRYTGSAWALWDVRQINA